MKKQAQQYRLNHRYLCPQILLTASHRQMTSSVAILNYSLSLLFLYFLRAQHTAYIAVVEEISTG
jgi:hypothetical protein